MSNGQLNPGESVFATQKVHCNRSGDEGVDALLVIYEGGYVEVHCEGECSGCSYGEVVKTPDYYSPPK
ncbi:hypothetical protein ES703_112013 [subsurface metagenome]